ncbi:DUF3558 domain-containing protein [Streptomyces gardneri]|uniref:DUF3558 family protein n=1 Tax=Nocardia TaxID=1817 RepID=UPI001358C4C9|nr:MULTISPECIES: DUF3558 family protein [Nocardia]MBF6166288.1 DUF3558 domain-containing protein [Streptomyces gardneri]MBF6205700.1 DUF3558 domain-containing protein [Streptomyces gardneri]
MTRKVRRDRAWLVVGAVVVAVTGCDTPAATEPAASPSSATTPALGPPPWTVAELTDHPCAVLGPDEIAGFVLDPHEVRAETPPQALPRCSWFSVQTSQAGRFNIGFAPRSSGLTDLSQRTRPDPLETEIEIGGRRATLRPEIRPDGRNGGCGTHVSVPSGGSFHLGIVAPGIATGVDWDVCAKTVAVATAISARLR